MNQQKFLSSLFLTMLLHLSFLSFGQNKINGTVTDANGMALEGATLQLKGTSIVTIADATGKYDLSSEQKFPWTIVLSHVSFVSKEFTVSQEGIQDFSLTDLVALSGVTIVGSRGKSRTDVNRSVPVDIFSAKELQSTGQIEPAQQLQMTSPSFNSAKYAINGSLVYADYATLHGLGSDQLLMLVNGKRRHQLANASLGFALNRGQVVTDLNAIPSLAMDHIEVLRDGAASQYGSDAIAGIINVGLKKTVNQGTFKTQYGVTSKGDGANGMAALNYGFKLGKENSFFNFTLQYLQLGESDRSDPYTGTIYNASKAKDDSIRAVRGFYPATAPFRVGVYGTSAIQSPQFFINAGYPLNDKWSLYTFGGYSYKKAVGYGFFRNAIATNANSNVATYPDGYTPQFPAKDKDFAATVGLSRTVLNGWNMDFSTGIGKNHIDRYVANSTNASIGASSPTDMFVGKNIFTQSITEANFTRNFEKALNLKSLNFAFGSQFRIDHFEVGRGDVESYIVGPLALSQGKNPGAQGSAGTAPENEVNEKRSNIAVYADAEADISEKFLITGGLRFENYSDFGENISGKITSRLSLTPNIALRGSINKGFRAPSLQQIFSNFTGTIVQAGELRFTKQYRNDDPFLAKIGIEDPKPEISLNFSLGLTAKSGDNFLFTVDGYQIDIKDRIIGSAALTVNNIPALKTKLQGTGLQQINFFTNHINTHTQGIDFVSTYKTNVGKSGKFTTSLAFAINHTTVNKIKATPAALSEGSTVPVALIDTIIISLIETAQPRQKLIFSTTYSVGKVSFVVRANHFGGVTGWEKPATTPHVKQVFTGKTLIDASVAVSLGKKLQITIGGYNINNALPDKNLVSSAAYSFGQSPYNRNVNQFGFNGAFYYANFTLNF